MQHPPAKVYYNSGGLYGKLETPDTVRVWKWAVFAHEARRAARLAVPRLQSAYMPGGVDGPHHFNPRIVSLCFPATLAAAAS